MCVLLSLKSTQMETSIIWPSPDVILATPTCAYTGREDRPLNMVAVHILAEAILEVQTTEATAVRDALAATKNLDTILGQFSFNADGDAVYDPIVLVVENGEVKVFE